MKILLLASLAIIANCDRFHSKNTPIGSPRSEIQTCEDVPHCMDPFIKSSGCGNDFACLCRANGYKASFEKCVHDLCHHTPAKAVTAVTQFNEQCKGVSSGQITAHMGFPICASEKCMLSIVEAEMRSGKAMCAASDLDCICSYPGFAKIFEPNGCVAKNCNPADEHQARTWINKSCGGKPGFMAPV